MSVDVIFIDDERSIRDAVQQTIELEDLRVACFASGRDALQQLDATFPGIIITDINMPLMNGIEVLQRTLQIDNELQVVMLTGHGDISTAVEAMREGAYDFIEKPFSTSHLIDVIRRGLDKRRLILENRDLRQELDLQSQPGPRLLGNTDEIQQIRRVLAHQKAQPHDLLICGESGAGKKLAARFLQTDPGRFHSISCQYTDIEQLIAQANAIPTFEPNLFYLEQVETFKQQTALVDWLAHKPTHIRVVASSVQSPQWLANSDNFLSSLYLRLSMITLHMPTLVQRKADIDLLFNNFCRNAASRFGITQPKLTDDERNTLFHYTWPGNVQELRAVAERFVLLGQGLKINSPEEQGHRLHLADMVLQFENNILSDALQRHQGRLKDVQEELGLARKTLYDKLKKHNIDKESYKG
ncbi:sigma-54-dependent transcriptional regulator [Thaumasiovibrio subtropicus]|uniref:sigma-54-dependent transcriptional regulator n=1 Tax=Thaumasiovibrio subtropicus TaxID=1891207 RepID=UPI000B35E425|nr:sigma-54 dependent transcriptional regulator [Thaumasiovibrio subtropicus]